MLPVLKSIQCIWFFVAIVCYYQSRTIHEIPLQSKLKYNHLTESNKSVPVGQNPSIVYTPWPNTSGNVFLIYNSDQGLTSLYCQDPSCDSNITHTLKHDVILYSSSLTPIDYRNSVYEACIKTIDKQTYHCTYYIVIGYASLTSNTDSISFIICYDNVCNPDYMDELIIDTSTYSNSVGYSTSLTTYASLSSGNRYPMFTYSKYSTELKQFVSNAIICLDFQCNTWIGKPQSSYPSNPPYVTLGIKPGGDNSVSIQETWSSQTNYVSIMFSKNVNITNTPAKNVYVLVIATCGLSSSKLVAACISVEGKELNSTLIFDNQEMVLKTNSISMIQYEPSAVGVENVPLFITSYIIHNDAVNLDELWLLYCFNIFCNSQNKTFYKVRDAKMIDYPQIDLQIATDVGYLPKIVFFENSTALMVMQCNYVVAPWNCTDLLYNHPVHATCANQNFDTTSMQISVAPNPLIGSESVIIYSQVMKDDIFNGSTYINCMNMACTINYGCIYINPYLSNITNCSWISSDGANTLDLNKINNDTISSQVLNSSYIYVYTPCRNGLSCNNKNVMTLMANLDNLTCDKYLAIWNDNNIATYDDENKTWQFVYVTSNECNGNDIIFELYWICDENVDLYKVLQAYQMGTCTYAMEIASTLACN